MYHVKRNIKYYKVFPFHSPMSLKTPAGLTSHDAIPEDEIWLKDKGHRSFKLNLQLCNVSHPNSQKNTCLLSMFMAGDSLTNLHTCMDMYSEQVSELQGMVLR